MTDRLAEQGALQYAVENLATAGTNPNRLGLAGYIHAAYTDYQTWAAANPGVNPTRLSARGRLYGYFYDNGDPDAVIAALFASGEQGAWYDPSDLSTMFQDSAGTTPVTEDGQPVGLILDKSKGLVLGPELFTNPGGPFTTTNGWNIQGTGTLTVDAGRLKVVQAVAWNDGVYVSSGATVIGEWIKYVLTIDIGTATLVQCQLGYTYGNGGTAMINIVASGTYTVYASPSSAFCGMTLKASSASTFYVSFASSKRISGNHASQANAAQRPLYKTSGGLHWLQFDGVDDSLATAAIDMSITSKVSIFAGAEKLTIENAHIVYSGVGDYGSARCFGIQAPLSHSGHVSVLVGDATQHSNPFSTSAPCGIGTNFIASSFFDLSATTESNQSKLRYNGVEQTLFNHALLTPGASFSSTYPTHIGRGGAGFEFMLNGSIYSLIILGRLATTQEITDTETWVASKTGVTLP